MHCRSFMHSLAWQRSTATCRASPSFCTLNPYSPGSSFGLRSGSAVAIPAILSRVAERSFSSGDLLHPPKPPLLLSIRLLSPRKKPIRPFPVATVSVPLHVFSPIFLLSLPRLSCISPLPSRTPRRRHTRSPVLRHYYASRAGAGAHDTRVRKAAAISLSLARVFRMSLFDSLSPVRIPPPF